MDSVLTNDPRLIVQFFNLSSLLVGIVAILYLMRVRRLAPLYGIPALTIYTLGAVFYVYVLTVRQEPSIIITTISSWLRTFEIWTANGMLIALIGKKKNDSIGKES